ncbi:MAG TPA: Flp pilus assembly protein CpaB [Gammaproteobacteria bacterium]|nr:Flp pilus assembly protein CpaB [Gammaproteobacteria bacterium]
MKLLAAAIGFGVLAALLAVFYLKMREAALRAKLTPNEDMIEVVVAKRDLVKGTVVEADPNNFAKRFIPKAYAYPDVITADQLPQVQGQKLVENLGAGKALLRSFLDDRFPRDFSDTIPLKRRAMTVQVDEVNSVNGFIRPGNRIDIMVSLPAGAAGERASDSVIPVLENIEVLATGRDSAYEYEEKMRLIQGGVMNAPSSNFTSITINVTPEQAALVETAQGKGDLVALLRNRIDTSGFGFTEVVPSDLMNNADKLAKAAAARASNNGVEKQGLTVGKDGRIRTKDGVVLKDQNLVVGADGTIRTKDGVVLSGRGLTINEKGELVTADGTVVDSSNLKVAADGTIMTKDGKVLDGGKQPLLAAGKALAGTGLKVAPDGTVTDKNGNVLAGVTVDKNGNVLKDGKLLAGVRIDANGNMVDANGKPVVVTENGTVLAGMTTDANGNLVHVPGEALASKGLKVAADGTVTDKNGKKLAGVTVDKDGKVYKDGKLLAGVRIDANGNMVDENGQPVVVTESGIVMKGATTNEKGEIVLADGTVVSPKDLVVNADGTVSTKDGQQLAGITADTGATAAVATVSVTVDATGQPVPGGRYDFLAGGVSKDGVATVNSVPLAD